MTKPDVKNTAEPNCQLSTVNCQLTSVCVYCASSTQIDEKYFRAAEELGRLIAGHGLTLITGAGKLGLMNTIENAALEAGGKVTGVIPTFMVREGWHHEGLTELIETPSMHERKQTMANLRPAGRMRHPGGTARNHHLEAAGTLCEPHRDTQHRRILRCTAGPAGEGRGGELHAGHPCRHMEGSHHACRGHGAAAQHTEVGQEHTQVCSHLSTVAPPKSDRLPCTRKLHYCGANAYKAYLPNSLCMPTTAM